MQINWNKIFIGIRLGLLQICVEQFVNPLYRTLNKWYIDELDNLQKELNIGRIVGFNKQEEIEEPLEEE